MIAWYWIVVAVLITNATTIQYQAIIFNTSFKLKMIAWYWIVVAVLITNAITSFTYEVFEWENLWVNFIGSLALIVLFVPISIYHICFKNTIHPISPARLEELRKKWANDGRCKVYHWFGGLYFCTAPKTSRIWNKVFFIRVK